MSARAEQPMGETPSTFHPSFNAGVVIEARVERLTSDAGAVIVREVMERSGIIEWLTERLHDPRQPHLVTYPLADLLRTMLLLFAQGWRDQDDADALRLDPALRLAAAGTRSTTPPAASPSSSPKLLRASGAPSGPASSASPGRVPEASLRPTLCVVPIPASIPGGRGRMPAACTNCANNAAAELLTRVQQKPCPSRQRFVPPLSVRLPPDAARRGIDAAECE